MESGRVKEREEKKREKAQIDKYIDRCTKG